ncbi:MAG: metal ABC transporter substrate-binding protein [Gammaproteobacteria bacterium]|nr:metal ABC transporter substrate-binding protein [Gammaproteobacteria bacterium]
MNPGSRVLNIALLLLVSFIAGSAERLTVYTVNYPLAYFAQRIGGEHINVVFPVPAGVDPAFWQPDVRDITAFQQADLVLLNGARYAKWIERASLPRRRLVDTSAAFRDAYINVSETVAHQHGPGGEHSHAGTAFTTWLDFSQAIEQARAIKLALEKMLPQYSDVFTRNFSSLERELGSLDQRIMAIVSQDRDKVFVASHPVYQYLTRRYNINLETVMWEPEVVPDQAQWQSMQQLLRSHKAKWMIWEGEPHDQSVKRLNASGINSLVFDPGANAPEKGDFISLMNRNIMELEKAYRE